MVPLFLTERVGWRHNYSEWELIIRWSQKHKFGACGALPDKKIWPVRINITGGVSEMTLFQVRATPPADWAVKRLYKFTEEKLMKLSQKLSKFSPAAHLIQKVSKTFLCFERSLEPLWKRFFRRGRKEKSFCFRVSLTIQDHKGWLVSIFQDQNFWGSPGKFCFSRPAKVNHPHRDCPPP